jgi:hypothetical protein
VIINELEKLRETSDGKQKGLNALMKDVKNLRFKSAKSKPVRTNQSTVASSLVLVTDQSSALVSAQTLSAPAQVTSPLASITMDPTAESSSSDATTNKKKRRAVPVDSRRKRKKPV